MNPVQYHININDRVFNFQMDFDPDFAADVTLHTMFQAGDIPEKEVISLMFLVTRPGDLVLDVGANVGLFSIFLSLLGCNVVAFEPSKLNFAKLKINMQLNKSNVWIHEWALSDKQEEVPFYEIMQDTGQSSLSPQTDETVSTYTVRTSRLDDFLETPRLIKLDCEGSEEKILRGGEQMLRRGVPFIVCELADENLMRFGANQHTLRKYMCELGYDCWLLRDDGHLPSYIPYGTTFNSKVLNLNVLFATEETVTKQWPYVDVVAGS